MFQNTVTLQRDHKVNIKSKAMEVGRSTRASTNVKGIPSSKASTGSQAAEVRTPFKVTPLKLKPADPANCRISNNMADCCKTICKVCKACVVGKLKFQMQGVRKSFQLGKHEEPHLECS